MKTYYYTSQTTHYEPYLVHHGVKGMKWGVRRYQNEDGSLTSAGLNKYYTKQKNVFGEDEYVLNKKGQKFNKKQRTKEKKIEAQITESLKKDLTSSQQHSKAVKDYHKYDNIITKDMGGPRRNSREIDFDLYNDTDNGRENINKRAEAEKRIHDNIYKSASTKKGSDYVSKMLPTEIGRSNKDDYYKRGTLGEEVAYRILWEEKHTRRR